jgi:hypothetical protein
MGTVNAGCPLSIAEGASTACVSASMCDSHRTCRTANLDCGPGKACQVATFAANGQFSIGVCN